MHVYLGGAHYIRVTKGRTRGRQVIRYEDAGATVVIERVGDEGVHPRAKLGAIVRVDDGDEPRVPLPKRGS